MATAIRHRDGRPDVIGDPTNDGAFFIEEVLPYTVSFEIEGVAPILFHAWSNESVEEKSKTPKGSAGRKTDDVESYVYRDEKGFIAIPGDYVLGSMTNKKNGAAKSLSDPRSPRKSALDLYRAGIVPLTILAPILRATRKKTKSWDYLDRRRAVVQQAAITRVRPAFHPGWRASFTFQVGLPEYIAPSDFLAVLALAGRTVGLGDYRPTFGRFQVISFESSI